MDYEIEEILVVVKKLTEKYTSKESSSVPYELARQLVEAAVYCVNAFAEPDTGGYLAGDKPDCMTAYEEGYQRVLEKAKQAKEIYHRVIQSFEDYGCRNYRDTLIQGMPAFFTKYDPKFNPQDHILTLDYPVLCLDNKLTGVNLILEYLKEAEYEQSFMQKFSKSGIVNLLESVRPDYRELYLDNLCEPVLLRALACLATERNLVNLELGEDGQEEAAAFFEKLHSEVLEERLRTLLDIIERGVMKEECKNQFGSCARGFAARIRAGVRF